MVVVTSEAGRSEPLSQIDDDVRKSLKRLCSIFDLSFLTLIHHPDLAAQLKRPLGRVGKPRRVLPSSSRFLREGRYGCNQLMPVMMKAKDGALLAIGQTKISSSKRSKQSCYVHLAKQSKTLIRHPKSKVLRQYPLRIPSRRYGLKQLNFMIRGNQLLKLLLMRYSKMSSAIAKMAVY
jgi:hypothetical protein